MRTNNILRTVVVTGSNKGIGYAILEKLLKGQTSYDIILAARNDKLGKEAQSALSQKHSSSPSKVTFRQLDINDTTSVDNFVSWIKSDRNGKVDVLVNNAGIGARQETPELRINELTTNFFNTVKLTEKVLPVLSKDGKVINVSSTLGGLSLQKPEVAKLLEDPSLTKERLLEVANQLVDKTKEGKQTELGWSDATYPATKALLNAYTRWILVKQLTGDQQAYTLHPGWCQTDMGGPNATDSVEEGAETPVYLINLPYKANDELNGKFFEKSKVRDF